MLKKLLLLYIFAIVIGAIGLPTLLVFLQNIQWYEIIILSLVYSSLIVAGGVGLIFSLGKERYKRKGLGEG